MQRRQAQNIWTRNKTEMPLDHPYQSSNDANILDAVLFAIRFPIFK